MSQIPALKMTPKVSVIMPSFLGDYPNAASNRAYKFIRAVQSFSWQTYRNCELVIVADGCTITRDIYYDTIVKSKIPGIKYTWLDKQPLFSGRVRNTGILIADGEIICYLDTDDYFEKDHIQKMVEWFQERFHPWLYFDDQVAVKAGDSSYSTISEKRRRENKFLQGRIGTSAIIHRKNIKSRWKDGYGHDWEFVNDLYKESGNVEVYAPTANGYVVCHIPGQIDL